MEGNKLYYSEKQDKHEEGVSFHVHKDIVNTVLGCRPVSSRLITIRLKASPFNITVIQAYAPTMDYSDEVIENFYNQLQEIIDKTPKKTSLWYKVTGMPKLEKTGPPGPEFDTPALEDHEGTVSIGGRTITNLRFVDDIDGLAGNEEELASLVEHLDKASSAFGMEIIAEKTKLMTNNPQGITTEIKINGIKLDTVKTFKYLGSIISDEGSRPEILAGIAQTTTVLTKLQSISRDKNISLRSKIHLMRSLALSVFLYACESWTLTQEHHPNQITPIC
uniref:Reverse transcriptase domain-containing protein n=1 Tax=Hippocampus comes TaxID=109280 RepID=A0A3Q2Z7T5_HIPCM